MYIRSSLYFCGLFTHPEEKAPHGSNMEVLELVSVAVPLLCYGWGFRATSVLLPPKRRKKKIFL